ncbi:MAG: DUF1330 domain-containing protein [Gammaproteobacteria bacterium]|nr:DUF1330 domain-containing protein [Gammaproteobacteria bacterium]
MQKLTNRATGYLLVLIAGVVLGASVTAANEQKAAYVIVSGTVLDADGMGPYREKAGPLARAAGISVLARSEATLLEGEWPHPPTITIEKFDSMQALKDFWYSDGYQEAKKLRDGKFKADFIVAVEAI